MTNYYVRTAANGGSDAAAGTSAGAAWATIGKALGASGIASGDTVYIGAGYYNEAVVTVGVSPAATTYVIGDVTGEYTGDAGEVAWTPFNSGLSSGPTTRCLDINGKSYLHFKNLIMYAGSTTPTHFDIQTSGSHDITFTDCIFAASGYRGTAGRHTTAFATASNILFDRCHFFSFGGFVSVILTSGTGADYNANIIYRNCTGVGVGSNGGTGFSVSKGGALANLGGGIRWENCTFFHSGGSNISLAASCVSTTYPCYVYNSNIGCGSHTSLAGGSAGQLIEDYNTLLPSATPRDANVSTGANSVSVGFFGFHSHQSFASGQRLRPFLTPAVGSLLLGRGTDASVSLTTDGSNLPRPAGGLSTSKGWGGLERHDTAVQEVSVTDAGTSSIKITGPGDQTIYVAVPASATVITIKTRFDTNHGTGNRPRAVLLANGKIGVATETKTATGAVDTWESLSFSSFTPTAAGVVAIRLESRSAAASGIAYFDTVTIS